MIRSFAFTTQGRLHSRDIETFLMPTLITIITTPLMMIGTWYGMKFRNMPELENGYWVVTLVMAVSTIATWWYFKRKKWF